MRLELKPRMVAATAEAVAGGPTVATESVVRFGNPADQIVGVAEAEGMDLVVVGTHSRTGLRRMLLGSVAERVVREIPCSVLVVRTHGGSESG